MNASKYVIKKSLFLLKPFQWKGFGIHSPYAFHLVNNVIGKRIEDPALMALRKSRKLAIALLKSSKHLYETNSVKEEIRKLRKDEAVDLLVFRLMNEARPKCAVFVGEGLAYTSAYLEKSHSETKLNFVGDFSDFDKFRAIVFKKDAALQTLTLASWQEVHKIDFLVISNLISEEDLQHIGENYHQHVSDSCAVIFLNMYRNPAVSNVWEKFKKEPFFKLSLDLFHVGILFARSGMTKQNYVKKYRF